MFICLHWRLFQTGRVEFLLFKVILLLSVGGFPVMFVGLITGETLHERDGVCMLDTVIYWSPRAGLVEVGWAGDGVRYLHDLSGWYSNILLLVAVDGSNGILDEAAVCQWSHNWWITELALMDPLVYPSNGGIFIVCCNAISWINTFKKIIKLHVHAMLFTTNTSIYCRWHCSKRPNFYATQIIKFSDLLKRGIT